MPGDLNGRLSRLESLLFQSEDSDAPSPPLAESFPSLKGRTFSAEEESDLHAEIARMALYVATLSSEGRDWKLGDPSSLEPVLDAINDAFLAVDARIAEGVSPSVAIAAWLAAHPQQDQDEWS